MRADLARGARAAAVAIGLTVLAVTPSRWVLSGLGEGGRAAALAAGIGADLSVIALPSSALALTLLALLRGRRAAQIILAAAAIALWAFMVSSTESSLSRGVFPSWVDVRIMRDSPDMMRGSLAMFALRRNIAPLLLAIAPAAALLAAWPAREGRPARLAAGAFALGAAAWSMAVATSHLAAPDSDAPRGTPLALVSPAMAGELITCLRGPCEPRIQLDHTPSSPELVARGAAMLGWPPPRERDRHPFTRAWPRAEIEAHPRAPARELIARLGDLSEELFTSPRGPVHVVQIALEGMRGDDLHPINPAAPRALAPFLAELYEQADARVPGVIAGRRAWTAGVRTPHGIAALTCGLGTLPHGLALPRDLPDLPLRCLPDVLAEAGFAVGHAYGGALAFDRIGPFLEAHGSRAQVSAATLPAGTPQGAWGASDRALYAASARAIPPDDGYLFVLSLSHHHPFTLPDDLDDETRARARAASSQATASADHEDERRLVTMAYADAALRDLFTSLRAADRLDRSVVVISADHSIPDRLLWRGRAGAIDHLASRASVPLVIWIAPRLFAEARSPARAAALSAEIQAAIDATPISQNDVPTLLLSLLESTPRLRALPRDRAFHTMGGQASSPWYTPPGAPATRVHGIHAGTALYFADERGAPTQPEEPAPFTVTAARGREVTPSLAPAAAALRFSMR